MDDWEKFNEASLLEKEDCYSHLNMEDTTDADYAHPKRVCKDFETKNVGEYHDLYVESDILLLADIFENFRNMCLETYELNHVFCTRITMTRSLKKDQSKIRYFK